MKRTLKRLSLIMIATALVFTGCKKDKDDKKNTRGTLDGYEWVDLGLPSGTKWATFNVGASSPEEYGSYYTWKNANYSAVWDGGRTSWYLPSKEEMEELANYCTWTWTSKNGVYGCNVTGKNGESIFLPAGGYRDYSYYGVGSECCYWTSSSGDNNYAFALFCYDDYTVPEVLMGLSGDDYSVRLCCYGY